MRIGIVCPYNVFRGGGVQECVFALQQELSSRGHYAKILTPQAREARGKTHHNENIIFLGGGTEVKSPFSTSAQISASVNMEAVGEILGREKFDVLHFHEPWVPILSRQLLTKSTSINVATFHAKLPDTIMSRTIERVITPYTKSIVKYFQSLTAVSPAAASYVQSLSSKPVTIVPNGIDLKKYQPSPKTKKTGMHILYIGRLERRKGIRYLLQAFDQLAAAFPAARLTIAGDGADRQKLQAYVHEQKIPRVEFLGYVDEKQKQVLLHSADLFCSPALYGESFGIVLLEAMASQIVTIAGNNPGYASVMQGRGALSIVNPKDTAEFARRMGLLLTDNELRDAWRRWAAAHVKQFDYSIIASRYETIYKQARHKR